METGGVINTVVLGTPWTGSSTAYSILDVLASVGRDWEMIHGAARQLQSFNGRLLSIDGKSYQDSNGRWIIPDGALNEYPDPDLFIVPDLHLDPNSPIPEPLIAIVPWIRAAYEGGAIGCSVCSGALLLAAARMLDDREATTHWAYADMLVRMFPEVRLRRERILVPAGEGHRIITAGGASAWADLLLYLISQLVNVSEARRIAKIYLIEPHTDGQLCYASLVVGRQHQDQVVAEAQVWAASHYDEPNPVSKMAQLSRLSERSFLRRFRSATGKSPIEYVQTLRVEEAKQMLESTTMTIDQIAEEVGYSEPSSLRSAFRKNVGLPASTYRKKWQNLGGRRTTNISNEAVIGRMG